MKHTLTRTTAFILTMSFPLTALAATIQVGNSIAGLGLDVTLTNAPKNAAVSIVVKDPKGKSTTLTTHTNESGTTSATLAGTKTEAAGTYTVSAIGADRTALASATAQVEPDTMDSWTSTIQAWSPRIEANGRDAGDITVTVRDRYGNPLAGRPVAVISSRPEDMIETVTPQTDKDGVQHFTLSTDKEGSIQIRAVDLLSGNTVVESAEMTAGYDGVGGNEETETTTANGKRFYYNAQLTGQVFGVLDRILVTAPSSLGTGEVAPKITIRAVDREGNAIENYNGTVRFKTTDPDATVPNFGEYTFKERDLGEKTFALALTFRTPGEQTLRVEDVNDARIFGEAMIDVNGSATNSAGQINITSHKDGDFVNALNIRLEGIGPRFANLIVMGGATDALTTTDDMGKFSVDVPLNGSQRDFTLRVRDDAGRYDSGSLHLILDQEKPEISSIQFIPKDPEEGDKVLIVVDSETNLASAMLRIPNTINQSVKEVTLVANPTQSGSYQAFFDAPAPGAYQPGITVMDKAGNVEELRTELTVNGKSLPIVQNVKATPRVDSVELTWDAVAGEVSGYRIYVGDDPSDFYSLNTDRAVTKATVKGLTPGKTYYFGITAVRGDKESSEKSELVEVQVLGFKLNITPEDYALNVQWTMLSELPLSAFQLEYGIDENKLSETRMINGELRDFTIRDLLSGVQYFVRITPITVTGEKLLELSANGNGTTTGSGFQTSPRDDIPFDTSTLPGDTLHPAPSNPSTGVSSIAWMSAVILGLAGVFYRIHQRKHIRQTAAFLAAVQSQYSQK